MKQNTLFINITAATFVAIILSLGFNAQAQDNDKNIPLGQVHWNGEYLKTADKGWNGEKPSQIMRFRKEHMDQVFGEPQHFSAYPDSNVIPVERFGDHAERITVNGDYYANGGVPCWDPHCINEIGYIVVQSQTAAVAPCQDQQDQSQAACSGSGSLGIQLPSIQFGAGASEGNSGSACSGGTNGGYYGGGSNGGSSRTTIVRNTNISNTTNNTTVQKASPTKVIVHVIATGGKGGSVINSGNSTSTSTSNSGVTVNPVIASPSQTPAPAAPAYCPPSAAPTIADTTTGDGVYTATGTEVGTGTDTNTPGTSAYKKDKFGPKTAAEKSPMLAKSNTSANFEAKELKAAKAPAASNAVNQRLAAMRTNMSHSVNQGYTAGRGAVANQKNSGLAARNTSGAQQPRSGMRQASAQRSAPARQAFVSAPRTMSAPRASGGGSHGGGHR
jgi:hypothetical protein